MIREVGHQTAPTAHAFRPGVPAAMERDAPLLELADISKHFGATKALSDVSIAFEAGKTHCVLGENGAGKSTIGKIIAGLYPPDAGSLRLDGRAIRFANPRQARAAGIAVVYQELSLAPDLSIRANIWLGSETGKGPWSSLDRRHEMSRVAEVMARLGLDVDSETPVRQLPAGLQQLVEIGKSLMCSPRVIVFDEPTAMLGAVEKERFFSILMTLRDSGIATILITHHMDDVMRAGDRVTVMRNGRHIESFDLDGSLDGDDVLERLTGQRQILQQRRDNHAPWGGTLLEIDVPAADGRRTLAIRKGEIAGLYGVLGCGAQELIEGLVGLKQPAHARYRLEGKAYQPRSPNDALRHGVGYLPAGRQSNGILPQRSIKENLMLTQLRHISAFGCLSRSAENEHAAQLLTQSTVKYGGLADSIESLSGGNQQKVLLARAMASARNFLVLEEPTAGVDIGAKQQIHERVRAAAAKGLTVLLLSSDLPENISLCDTVYTLYQGHVVNRYDKPDESCQAHIVGDVLGQQEVTT